MRVRNTFDPPFAPPSHQTQRTRLLEQVGDGAAHDHLRLLLGGVHVVLGLLDVHRVQPGWQIGADGADARALEDLADELIVLLVAILCD